jgi:cytochrome P450
MKKTGDLFLTVSPGAINLWVTDAEAAHQITSHREQFPKPLESYRILTIFGENIITTEGNEWRKHRKVSAPGFNEKNNVMVFAESCKQTQGMLKGWLGPNGTGNISLTDVPGDALRLTLHIISLVGFGVHLLWPGEMPGSNAEAAVFSSNEPVAGHTMSFEHSLETLLERMIVVLLLPEWLMSKPPESSYHHTY